MSSILSSHPRKSILVPTPTSLNALTEESVALVRQWLTTLTILGDGEEWVVKSQQPDKTGRLWSPGVQRGSRYHLNEFFGPVLGIMNAETLVEAVAIQNGIGYGPTAGLHPLDPEEIRTWIDSLETGILCVNHGITGAFVQRQPFGGWKAPAVGAGTKVGGLNYLVGLGSWTPVPTETSDGADLTDHARSRLAWARAVDGVTTADLQELKAALHSDAAAWRQECGVSMDASEHQIHRCPSAAPAVSR